MPFYHAIAPGTRDGKRARRRLLALRRQLDDEIPRRTLGLTWTYIVTDTTEGGAGNRERTAFLFDTRKVTFGGLAGEVVLPPKRRFEVPQELQRWPSNAGKTRHFDPIAFRRRPGSLEPTGQAGVFDYYQSVFREQDETAYKKAMGDGYLATAKGKARSDKQKATYYRSLWRTFQMSDHLPMWVEVRIDYSDAYLEDLLARKKGG